jgi:hypothetical protein
MDYNPNTLAMREKLAADIRRLHRSEAGLCENPRLYKKQTFFDLEP